MHAVQANHPAGPQPHPGRDRRHVVVHQKADLGRNQLEPREKVHPVRVLLGLAHAEGVVRVEHRETAVPPRVGLEKKQDVRPALPNHREQRLDSTVALEDIRDEQPDAGRVAAGGGGRSLCGGQPRERKNADRLRETCEKQGRCEDPDASLVAIEQQEHADQRERGQHAELQAWEVE